MKRFRVASVRGYGRWKEILELIRQNKILFVFFVIFLVGMCYGALGARHAEGELIERLDFLFASNYTWRSTQPILSTFIASLTSLFIFLSCPFLLGLSAWGVCMVPFIPFFRGIGVGFAAGHLYAVYGWKGVFFYILVILPGVFLSMGAILLQTKEAFLFSLQFLYKVTPKGNAQKLWEPFKQYLVHSGYLFIVAVASSLLDTFCAAIFTRWFIL